MNCMNWPDAAGYLASALVVLAFCMQDIISLRIAPLGSNVAFLAYGIALGLAPVWLLHAVLLPVNGFRLWQAIWRRERPRGDRPTGSNENATTTREDYHANGSKRTHPAGR
jgi:hypothetical protein